MELQDHERHVSFYFGTVGRVGELAAGAVMEREVARVPQVARSLHEGVAGALWTAAKVATASSLVISLLPGRTRGKRIAAGVLGTVGALCLRFAVFHAGRASALNPRATFHQQRAGL
jgi:hypothetical protein